MPKLILLHPPLDDPTLPYHSTAYLAGHLVANGFTDVSLRDVNAELVDWTLREEVFTDFVAEAGGRLHELSGRDGLTFAEQEQYYHLWAHPDLSFAELTKAVRGMRSFDTFLDWREYQDNVNILLRYFAFLGVLSYPGEVANFRQVSRGRFSPYNLRDLFDPELAAEVCRPFGRFLDRRLSEDAEMASADAFGISVVYDHQLFHTLHLCRWLRRRWPEKRILLGGTAMSQLYKYLKDPGDMKRFFEVCDAIVVGEGETTLCELAELEFEPRPGLRNLITYDGRRDELQFPPHVHYENVRNLGSPLYDYDWDLYLSPARGINYAPTRGCYWNRCTFCDYGLNFDKPTSPWRERAVETVVEDLRETVRTQGVRYVYFAVDVMSPKYLDKLSDALLEADLDIRWSAELRMEKVFSPERCQRMAEAGCVCVSFGMESGSQRVLDLIDKGTRVEYMGRTMQHFAEAEIAVQLMAFSGFPGETAAEKAETVQFVREHSDHWSTGGLGNFLLTGTAIVAKDPARFGVRLVETQDADIARALAYELEEEERGEDGEAPAGGDERDEMLVEDFDASFDSDGGLFPRVLGRPWAGGTDSLHTMIYYERFGRRFFRDYPLNGSGPVDDELSEEELGNRTLFFPGHLSASPFDIERLVANRRALAHHLRDLNREPREPTLAAFRRWSSEVPPLARNPVGTTYWIRAREKCLQLDKLTFRLLSAAREWQIPIHELLSPLEPALASRVRDFLRNLARHGFLQLNVPRDGAAASPRVRPSGPRLRAEPEPHEHLQEMAG